VITLTGVINDLHIPFHDPVATQLVLDAFEDIGIDRLVINGDALDFYNVNMHGPKHPEVQENLEDEFYAGHEFFSNLKKRFKNIVFIMGNHEDRLDRFILKHCKPFSNIVTVEKMLDLSGIEVVPYNQEYKLENTKLRIQHSPPSYSKNGAMVSLERKMDLSHIYGCSHRVQHACKTGGSGEVYNVWYNGWLGSTRLSKQHRRVFSFAKGHENWQQCASLVTVVNKKMFHVEQSQIINNTIRLNGNLYEQ
jgi:hypothetical protein